MVLHPATKIKLRCGEKNSSHLMPFPADMFRGLFCFPVGGCGQTTA